MKRVDDAPVLHGGDHRPGGADPTRPGPWVLVGSSEGPPFVNGSNALPTDLTPSPVPMQFRLTVGRPNFVVAGEIIVYTEHSIEIQGDVSDVSPGDIVFVLPLEFQQDHDVPCHSHDDDGNYVPCRLLSTGEFIYGVP